MKLSEESQLGIDLIEMRTRIAMYVLWTHGHSVANIGMRFNRKEAWVRAWIDMGFPLQDVDNTRGINGSVHTEFFQVG